LLKPYIRTADQRADLFPDDPHGKQKRPVQFVERVATRDP
jgi:hypothetical protein